MPTAAHTACLRCCVPATDYLTAMFICLSCWTAHTATVDIWWWCIYCSRKTMMTQWRSVTHVTIYTCMSSIIQPASQRCTRHETWTQCCLLQQIIVFDTKLASTVDVARVVVTCCQHLRPFLSLKYICLLCVCSPQISQQNFTRWKPLDYYGSLMAYLQTSGAWYIIMCNNTCVECLLGRKRATCASDGRANKHIILARWCLLIGSV